MWISKVRVNGTQDFISSKAKKHNVTLLGYPISAYETKNSVIAHIAGSIFGQEKNKTELLKDLRSDSRVLHLEGKNNFLICKIKEPKEFRFFYSPQIIYTEPVLVDPAGKEYYTIASWTKFHLMQFVQKITSTYDSEVLFIKSRELSNIQIVSMQPNLTKKQKQAMELAVGYGYYEYPRKTNLKTLANKMKISYATFQAHLRKAEQKLIPHISRRNST